MPPCPPHCDPAVATATAMRAENQISLVWTGPTTEAVGLRSTRSVLETLVANATGSLVLVSFASYDVADLTEALASAIARGVEVTLILETPDDPGAPLVIGSAHPFAPIKNTASFYRWPLETRETFFAATARLHAKCIIADQSSALITSANLTSAGINDNIELGVLIEAGPLPRKPAQAPRPADRRGHPGGRREVGAALLTGERRPTIATWRFPPRVGSIELNGPCTDDASRGSTRF